MKELEIVLRQERKSASISAGAGSSTNAMNVVGGIARNIIVDDQIDFRDVQTSANNNEYE